MNLAVYGIGYVGAVGGGGAEARGPPPAPLGSPTTGWT